jgi:chromosome segregation ATPase
MENDVIQPTNAMERITLKRQLVARLAEIEARLSGPQLSNLDCMVSKISEARNRLESLTGNKPDSRRDAAKAEYDLLVSKQQTLSRERNDLLREHELIQSELDQLSPSVTMTEINEQAAKLRTAKDTVSSLDGAIEKQRSIIHASNVAVPDDLLRQKEDLLADSATGKNVGKKLEAVETKIKEYEQNRSELAQQAKSAELAIVGLERRRSEAEQVVKAENETLNEMLTFHFKSELQTAYSAFIEAGNELAKRFRRVAGLDALVTEYSGGREKSMLNVSAQAYRLLDITRNADGFIFDARGENPAQWSALERDRQTAAGVPL